LANSKRDVYFEMAENMFVLQGKTREEIATQLKLGEKTVRNWAQDGGWESKKASFLDCRQATHLELYGLLRQLTASIRMDMDAKKEVSQARWYALTNLTQSLEKVKKFEGDVAADEKAKDKDGKGDPEKAVREVNEILGLT